MSITELSKIKKKMELTPPFFEETMQKKQGPDTIITETEDMENLTGGISMKIGDFSRSVGVSVDTIRYYISLGLLIPNSQGEQLSFGIREQNDMEIILKMKHLYFSLHEIHEYLDIHRMNNMVEEESLTDVKRLLSNLEQLHLERNILYIADASTTPPLKKGSVDLLISFTGDNEHSLYFRSSYIADCEPYLSPSAHVLGAKLEYDSRALSLKRLRQSYPEGNGNGYCRGMTCNAYEKLGFRWQEQAIGEMEVIRKKFAYRNHVDGEKLQISCFHASRDPSFKK